MIYGQEVVKSRTSQNLCKHEFPHMSIAERLFRATNDLRDMYYTFNTYSNSLGNPLNLFMAMKRISSL